MTSIFGDENKLYSKKHSFAEIPPRKLLLSKKSIGEIVPDMASYESNLLKFLPCNENSGGDLEDSDLDPYSSEHFRMYEFKVRRCTRSRSHDWTDCPFAHPGEKARRRDPRKFHYSGTVCPEFRRGGCSRGESCEFAHGVFECWLHPSRYRTEACKDGRNCKRKVCFFAHTPRQLRLLPEINSPEAKFEKAAECNHGHCCCLSCHSVISSPTSTLMAAGHMSPPLSPPLSPVKRCGIAMSKLRSGVFSYKDVLNELMSSLEAMNFSDGAATVSSPMARNYFSDGSSTSSPISAFNTNPWIDQNSSFNGQDHQQNLNFSPNNSSPNSYFKGKGLFLELGKEVKEEINGGVPASFGPDLGWVNELLM
ncbi:zinc finger CCCH domain-containing protein 2 [Euphorbia lathyris]|uniref:zinc finger CCCH domain-containing protein 2 n=1 Tax=Euphorbia lathyris TaxID=212925 RepID=UPI003313513B